MRGEWGPLGGTPIYASAHKIEQSTLNGHVNADRSMEHTTQHRNVSRVTTSLTLMYRHSTGFPLTVSLHPVSGDWYARLTS
jgi:hypothetical protein